MVQMQGLTVMWLFNVLYIGFQLGGIIQVSRFFSPFLHFHLFGSLRSRASAKSLKLRDLDIEQALSFRSVPNLVAES